MPLIRLTLTALIALLLSACMPAPSHTVELGSRGLLSVRLSPSADQVLVGTVQHGAHLWDRETGQLLASLRHAENDLADVVAGAFSIDGRHLVTAERQNLIHWDMSTRQVAGHWATDGLFRSVDISANGQRILAGLSTQEAWLIDRTGQRMPAVIPHADAVGVVRFAPDGRIGVTGADDGMLRVWDLETGATLMSWKFPAAVAAVVFSADQRLLFAAPYHGPAKIWDLSTGQVLIDRLGERRISLISARFSADRRLLLTGSPTGEMALWSVKTGKRLQRWKAPRPTALRPSGSAVLDVSFLPGEQSVAAALSSGQVLTWPR